MSVIRPSGYRTGMPPGLYEIRMGTFDDDEGRGDIFERIVPIMHRVIDGKGSLRGPGTPDESEREMK